MRLAKKLLKKLSARRGPPPSYSRPRRETLLNHIDISSQVGLEIGPLSHPIVTKAESNGQIFYVDSATAEQLRAKYRDDTYVKADAILETDFLWGEQTLPELVDGKLYDYVLASHVIEHVPNMIGWLREVASVLRDDGILSLAIPDKRYTFDLKRELTSFGALVESYLLDRRRPSTRDVFDHKALAVHVDLIRAWSGTLVRKELVHHNSLETAWAEIMSYHASNEYVDVHVNIVTPASFLEILDCINRVGLLDLTVVNFVDTERNTFEFFVTLQRTPRGLGQGERLARQRESIGVAQSRIEIRR